MGNNSILKWLTIPPIVAVATAFLARLLGGLETGPSGTVDPSLWVMGAFLFAILTVLYGLFILRNFPGLVALQCAVQGMLFCLLSLNAGGRLVPWIGVVLTVSGAAALVTGFQRSQARARSAVREPGGLESRIPVPFVITDDMGTVLTASEAMLKALDLPSGEVLGHSVTTFLALGEETVEIRGKIWDMVQEQMDEKHFYFQLKEKSLPIHTDEPAPEEAEKTAPTSPFVDSTTHLAPASYAMIRLEEEMYRAKRYEHPLTVALFRLAFPEGNHAEAFNAYCDTLRRSLRASDTASVVEGSTLLIVLPECPAIAGEVVLQRLLDLMHALGPNYGVFYSVTALHVLDSLNGSEGGAQAVLTHLNEALSQKYSLDK